MNVALKADDSVEDIFSSIVFSFRDCLTVKNVSFSRAFVMSTVFLYLNALADRESSRCQGTSSCRKRASRWEGLVVESPRVVGSFCHQIHCGWYIPIVEKLLTVESFEFSRNFFS